MTTRFNPTLAAILRSWRTNSEHSSKRVASRAANEAVGSSPPGSGDLYDHETHLVNAATDEVSSPAFFANELKFDAAIGFIGIILLFIPLLAGLSGASLLIFALGVVMVVHSVDGVFLKDCAGHIDSTTLVDAKAQGDESGEINRKPIGLLGTIVIIAICGLEAFLNADSVVAILGESRMTPTMVRMISVGLTILIAYFLYKSMLAAAKEKRENQARRTIRHLDASDPTRATAMKTRLGTALQGEFAPIHEKSTKQIQFWALFFLITVLSLGLRVGFLLMPHNGDEPSTTPSSATEKMIFKKSNTIVGV